MNETKPDGGGTLNVPLIVGLCILIVLLVLGINGIFGFLHQRLPYGDVSSSASVSASYGQVTDESGSTSASASSSAFQEEAPRFCPSCGKELHEGFQWGQYCPYCGEQVN